MSRAKLTIVIAVAIIASVVACGLILVSNSSPYSSPEKSLSAFVAAESRADLSAMEKPSGAALYQNFIGHFGETKYRAVRNVYQQAYDLAEPSWQQYREKARTAAAKERERLAEDISKAGRDAFSALPADNRLQLTEDRPRFNEFIFEEGVKALPANEREKIGDPQAFREGRDFNQFVDRQGFALLSDEDQRVLKSPAALSSALTPERVAFLESVGLPLLSAQQRQVIDGIPSSELRNPQDFMQRYGRDPARDFLRNSALDQKVTMGKCHYIREDNFGSLFKGSSEIGRAHV